MIVIDYIHSLNILLPTELCPKFAQNESQKCMSKALLSLDVLMQYKFCLNSFLNIIFHERSHGGKGFQKHIVLVTI